MKKMKNDPLWNDNINEDLRDALVTVNRFIYETTGQSATQTEIAAALKRYFVLNEIKEHIVMERS